MKNKNIFNKIIGSSLVVLWFAMMIMLIILIAIVVFR